MADSIGRQIADAVKAPEPEFAAAAIVKTLLPGMSAKDNYVAISTIAAALVEWRKQLLGGVNGEVAKWKRIADDSKMEMEELKTRLYLIERERSGK